jgi:maleate isomerase
MLTIGILTPHSTPGPEIELPAIAPGNLVTRVARIGEGDPPTTAAALRTSTSPAALGRAAGALLDESIDAVAYASTTSAFAIGFDAETAIVSALASRLALPVVSTCESAVLALRDLRVERIALVGAPWFEPELNELGATYFRSQGFDVVSSRSAALPQDPARIEPTAVLEWVTRHVPDTAETIFIGGNGFRAAAAIGAMEHAIGRPVLESNQVLLWRILRETGDNRPIRGFGRLLELGI